MDANERWRRASESADRFSPFRRRPPVFVGLLTALVALISNSACRPGIRLIRDRQHTWELGPRIGSSHRKPSGNGLGPQRSTKQCRDATR